MDVAAAKGHTEIVQLLLSQPAIEFNCKDDSGKTALDYAKEKNRLKIIELLNKATNPIISPVQTSIQKSEEMIPISPDKGEEKSDAEEKISQLEAEVLKSRENYKALKEAYDAQMKQMNWMMEQINQLMNRQAKYEEQLEQKDQEIARLKEGQK